MNVNFTVFADKILSGEKRQTIRKASPRWKNVKAGDKLSLYAGLRTKNCRKLGTAEVDSIEDIKIVSKRENPGFTSRIWVNGKALGLREYEELSKADGFCWIVDFLEFFHSHYGKNFEGKIIKWTNFKKVEK